MKSLEKKKKLSIQYQRLSKIITDSTLHINNDDNVPMVLASKSSQKSLWWENQGKIFADQINLFYFTNQ